MIYIVIGASVILVIAAILLLTTLMKGTAEDRKKVRGGETESVNNPAETAATEISDSEDIVEDYVIEGIGDPEIAEVVNPVITEVVEPVVTEVAAVTENIDKIEDFEIMVNDIKSVVEGVPEVVQEVVETETIADVIEEVDKTNGLEIEPDATDEESASEQLIEGNNTNLHEISSEIIEALEKLTVEADDLKAKTLHLAEQTLSLNKEKMQLALEKEQLKEEKNQLKEEKNQLKEEKNQLAEEKTQLVEEKEQLAAENKSIKLEANALESLLQEKYIQIEELENVIAGPEEEVTEYQPAYDVRTAIRDILPDLQAMANEAMVDFSLKIDEIKTPFAVFDKNLVNNMILRMVFSGLRYSNPGGRLIFSISQVNSYGRDYAEYVYTCIYLGEQVDFFSEEAAALGGVVDIQRTPDGGVALSVRVRFKIDKPDFSYLDTKIEQTIEQ